jgi:hypothetical protein
MDYELVSEDFSKRKIAFNKAYDEEFDPQSAAWTGRANKGLPDCTEFTYGEAVVLHFVAALEYVGLKAGETFWDIGCGAGIPNMAASIFFPDIKVSKGVELIDELYNLAIDCQKIGTQAIDEAGLTQAPLEYFLGDMFKIDWSDADVIYISNLCFPEELTVQVSHQAEKCAVGTRIICLRPLADLPHLK